MVMDPLDDPLDPPAFMVVSSVRKQHWPAWRWPRRHGTCQARVSLELHTVWSHSGVVLYGFYRDFNDVLWSSGVPTTGPISISHQLPQASAFSAPWERAGPFQHRSPAPGHGNRMKEGYLKYPQMPQIYADPAYGSIWYIHDIPWSSWWLRENTWSPSHPLFFEQIRLEFQVHTTFCVSLPQLSRCSMKDLQSISDWVPLSTSKTQSWQLHAISARRIFLCRWKRTKGWPNRGPNRTSPRCASPLCPSNGGPQPGQCQLQGYALLSLLLAYLDAGHLRASNGRITVALARRICPTKDTCLNRW